MRDELEALDSGEASRIEAATAAKTAALDHVRRGGTVPLAQLAEARALNALAASRINVMMAGVERRLAALAGASGRGGALCYGRDGRTVVR